MTTEQEWLLLLGGRLPTLDEQEGNTDDSD